MSAPITPGPNPINPSGGPTLFPTPSVPIGPIFGFTPGLGRPHIGIPVHIPHGEVQGYMMPNELAAEDDAVTRAAAKFQTFYDALAPDEQEIIALLLERAAGVRE